MKPTFEVDGDEDLSRGFRKVAADVDKALDKASKAGGEAIAEKARPKTPVRSGALRRTVRGDKGGAFAGSAAVPYAATVHRTRPFLTDAAADAESKVRDVHLDAVDEILDPIRHN